MLVFFVDCSKNCTSLIYVAPETFTKISFDMQDHLYNLLQY